MRDRFEFLLDLLPCPPGRAAPNRNAPAFLPLPKNRRHPPFTFQESPPLRILVSFGAEDPRRLSVPTVKALLPPPDRLTGDVEITLVQGGLNRDSLEKIMNDAGCSVTVRRDVPNLREELARFDLVVTHFGLTAFEALRAGAQVILLSPTAYHERLARRSGFISMGIRRRGISRLRRLIYTESPRGNCRAVNYTGLNALTDRFLKLTERYGLDTGEIGSLGALSADAVPRISRSCPLCGAAPSVSPRASARFPGRTYRRCFRCGMVFMLRSGPPPIEYETAYFFEQYREQYGKTYLEDFPYLKHAGKLRLERIRDALPPSPESGEERDKPKLLDIGCAYGPFLAAAKEEGFSPFGIDPAEDAVRFVRQELNLPAYRRFFPDLPEEIARPESFTVITLWYVIEHFEDPRKALQAVFRLLKPGGVLAFSTPSVSGISGRKSLRNFLEKSPGDHWTIWDPRRVSRLLARYGFKVKKITVTGHHPERFPLGNALNAEKQGAAYRILGGLSRLCGLGDTFEVYAVKRR
jgi:2-polyprenyl-3-methyl-5-hydroxy-6-metoxy-1,4-benzoquinol methylase